MTDASINQHSRESHAELDRLRGALERRNKSLATLTGTVFGYVGRAGEQLGEPIETIREYAAALGDGIGGDLTGEQRDLVRTLKSATRELERRVDALVLTSRLRARHVPVERRTFPVRAIGRMVWTRLIERAAGRGISVERGAVADGASLHIDYGHLERLMVTIAELLFAYTLRGGALRLDISVEDGEVRLALSTPANEQSDAMFETSRAQLSGEAHEDDLDLRLEVVRELARLHYGNATLTRDACGVIYTLAFPIAEPSEMARHFARTGVRTGGLPVVAIDVWRTTDVEGPLHKQLSAVIRPTDLILSRPDGSAIIMGRSAEPDGWIARIKSLCEGVDASEVGTWESHDEETIAGAIVASYGGEVRAVA